MLESEILRSRVQRRQPMVDPKTSRAWPLAVAAMVVTALLCLTTYLVLRSLARIPQAAVDQTREVLEAAEDLLAAFRQGTVETRFITYATSIAGTSYLQIATIDRTEVFTREDRASIFWGAVQLPDVVVSATAPVQYTAYVDLDAVWHFRLDQETIRVVAPPIAFNRPSIDVSRIEFEVREDSLLRDEDAALEELERGLTGLTRRQTQELEPLVRETARGKIENFVRTWLLQNYAGAESKTIEVRFADEVESDSPLLAPGPDR